MGVRVLHSNGDDADDDVILVVVVYIISSISSMFMISKEKDLGFVLALRYLGCIFPMIVDTILRIAG